MTRAINGNAFDEESATEVDYSLKKAIQETKKPEAQKTTLLEYMDTIKKYSIDVKEITNAVKSIITAISAMSWS